MLLPPSNLLASVDSAVFDAKHLRHMPPLQEPVAYGELVNTRRNLFKLAAGALASISIGAAHAVPVNKARAAPSQAEMLKQDTQSRLNALAVEHEKRAQSATDAPFTQAENLKLGDIPSDFWLRPRELKLKRQSVGDEISVVYWKDGKLVPEGYWQACALMRDVRQNLMTSMDPSVLDILYGISGFYRAWNWPHSPVITSGFRTLKTNGSIKEGAAKNSMHLYGKAVDLYIPGIPAKDVSALGVHLKQGGVGFYPGRNFTHLDTGKLRLWKGK